MRKEICLPISVNGADAASKRLRRSRRTAYAHCPFMLLSLKNNDNLIHAPGRVEAAILLSCALSGKHATFRLPAYSAGHHELR
jgi:hypothetical protein